MAIVTIKWRTTKEGLYSQEHILLPGLIGANFMSQAPRLSTDETGKQTKYFVRMFFDKAMN
jgi:hypothetical protein